jgi:hypothetical protein
VSEQGTRCPERAHARIRPHASRIPRRPQHRREPAPALPRSQPDRGRAALRRAFMQQKRDGAAPTIGSARCLQHTDAATRHRPSRRAPSHGRSWRRGASGRRGAAQGAEPGMAERPKRRASRRQDAGGERPLWDRCPRRHEPG